jgi:RNA polymerase sigma-70 factor (ECF subfamily)
MGGENAAAAEDGQDGRYARAAAAFGPALARLARAYEADPDQRQDLLQDIHLALWRSFATFDDRCSERTWLYRVAHNVATSHMLGRRRRGAAKLLTLDELASHDDPLQPNPEAQVADRNAAARLMALVQALAPTDRQVVLLYLEGLEASAIGEICGRSPGAVATQLHRLKGVLAQRFNQAINQGGPR